VPLIYNLLIGALICNILIGATQLHVLSPVPPFTPTFPFISGSRFLYAQSYDPLMQWVMGGGTLPPLHQQSNPPARRSRIVGEAPTVVNSCQHSAQPNLSLCWCLLVNNFWHLMFSLCYVTMFSYSLHPEKSNA